MRIVKGIISLILVLGLLFTAGLAMGLNAAQGAMNADAIQRAMTKSALMEEVIGDALADSAAQLNGVIGADENYQDMAQEILGNDALMESISGYLASSINSEIYGDENNAEALDAMYDGMIDSLTQEIEGLAELEGYDISQAQEDYIQQTIESELPDLTAQIDQQIENYEMAEPETLIGSFLMDDGLRAMMAQGFRTILTVISVILGIAIIVLGWRSRLGFLWCTLVMGALSVLYVTLSLMGEFLAAIMGATETESMLITMLTEGFGQTAGTGFIITAVLLAAFIILKIIDRRRNRYEKDFKTSERYA